MGNAKLAFKVTVHTQSIAGLEWPDELPVPNIGDDVMWQHDDQTFEFRVTNRQWQIGTDLAGAPLAILAITGESPQPVVRGRATVGPLRI